MLIAVRPTSKVSFCPICGTRSERIHSRYPRRLADLPLVGKPVRLVIEARRFHCDAVLCDRRIFAERFDGDILAPSARRTARLDHIVHHLGLALGGRPAATFAKRLMLPVSNDTLLRVVRRRGSPRFVPPTVIGVDDWAWRRNQRYGTIICDLERHKTIALLPDREPSTAQAWLSDQPQISIVARDRGGGYATAAAKALPRQPGIPRCGAQIDAPDPNCDRSGHDQPRTADGRREDPVRGISSPGKHQRRNSRHGQVRSNNQGDRAPDRIQSRPCPTRTAWSTFGCLPRP